MISLCTEIPTLPRECFVRAIGREWEPEAFTSDSGVHQRASWGQIVFFALSHIDDEARTINSLPGLLLTHSKLCPPIHTATHFRLHKLCPVPAGAVFPHSRCGVFICWKSLLALLNKDWPQTPDHTYWRNGIAHPLQRCKRQQMILSLSFVRKSTKKVAIAMRSCSVYLHSSLCQLTQLHSLFSHALFLDFNC